MPLRPGQPTATLATSADAAAGEQEAIAVAWGFGTPNFWWAKAYFYTTVRVLLSNTPVPARGPALVTMRDRQTVLFHASYRRGVVAYRSGAPIEPNWHIALTAAGTGVSVASEVARLLRARPPVPMSKRQLNRFVRAIARNWCTFATADAVLVGVQAHVRFDLPRALAAAYLQEKELGTAAPFTSFDDFKSDFAMLNSTVFPAAAADLTAEIKRHCRSWSVNPATWTAVQEAIAKFVLSSEREDAWWKAGLLVWLAERGYGDPEIQDRFQRLLAVRFPRAKELFDQLSVADTAISGYDWTDQPI